MDGLFVLQKSMKKQITIFLLSLLLFQVVGCNDSSNRSSSGSDGDSSSEEESMIEDIETAFGDVTQRLRSLEYEIDDFDSENWRDNVTDVQYEFDRLKRAVSDVESEFPTSSNGSKLGDIETAFNDLTHHLRSLENEIDDFDSENWEDNVTDVQYEFDRLKRSVSDVESEF